MSTEKKKMQNAKGKIDRRTQPTATVLMGAQLAAWLNGFCEPALAAPVVVQGV